MKKRTLIYFLAIFLFSFQHKAKAQFVVIPDSNFVDWLNANGFSGCMNGNLMDTMCTAITTGQAVHVNLEGLHDLTGIEYFDNLEHLNCANNALTFIPPLPSSIRLLECNGNQLTSLPPLPEELQVLNCYYNQITALQPDLPDSLEMLYCHYNQITIIPPMTSKMHFLSIGYNPLVTLPALPPDLEVLGVANLNLTQLPSLPASILTLGADLNSLTSLPVLPPGLQILTCGNNQLTELPPLPHTLLQLLTQNNQLTWLPPLPDSLTHLYIYNNPIACLPEIKTIGNFQWDSTGITCLPNVLYPAPSIANPSIAGIPVCDLFNVSGCEVTWNISGYVYKDSVQNCIFENTEPGLNNIKVNLYKNGNLDQQTFTDHFGNFTFNADTGNYLYNIDTTYLPLTVVCPVSGSHSSQITSSDSMDTDMNFAVECPPYNDLGVTTIVQLGGDFRPAHQALIQVLAGDMAQLHNFQCSSGSGSVTIVIQGSASFDSPASGALTPTVIGDTLFYSIAEFSMVNFYSDFVFNLITDTTAQSGDLICLHVTVNPVGGDPVPSNNTYLHCFQVENSFDPNDKQVNLPAVIDTSVNWLTYTVRFQNTGTAPALHIYIADTLDNNLDPSSLQLTAFSHEPLVQQTGNILLFNFPGINLADSSTNEPGSHGFIQYKVHLNDPVPVGTTIHNTAYIYFDFNPPVQTNTTSNTVQIISSVNDVDPGLDLMIFPNPSLSGMQLNFKGSDIHNNIVEIRDLTGRILMKEKLTGDNSVQLPMLADGIYECILYSSSGVASRKLVITSK